MKTCRVEAVVVAIARTLAAFLAFVCLAFSAVAKPPTDKGGGGGGGGEETTAAPPRSGELYYWIDWDLWRAPADGSSPPEVIGPGAQLLTTNREIAVSNHTYSGEPWCVVVLPAPDEYYLIANADGTYREIEVREMYAMQFYRDQDGTLQSTDMIQLTDTYGSDYWFDVQGLAWDKTGADSHLTYRALDISMRLTDQRIEVDGKERIVLDDTQTYREVEVEVPLPASTIAPEMAPLSGASFAPVFVNGNFADGFVTDRNGVSLDPSLQVVAGVAHTDSGSFLEFFDAATTARLFDGPATSGGGGEWNFAGEKVAYEGLSGLESVTVNLAAEDPIGSPITLVPLGKSNGSEVLYAVNPHFSPDGTYLMYRSREKAKGSSTNYLRIVSATGEHNFVVSTNGKPVRWISGSPAP